MEPPSGPSPLCFPCGGCSVAPVSLPPWMAPTISTAHSVLFQWGKNSLKREKMSGTLTRGGAVQVLKHAGGGASVLLLFRLLNSSWVPAGPRLYVWAQFKCSVSHRNSRFGQHLQALSVAVLNVHYGCRPFLPSQVATGAWETNFLQVFSRCDADHRAASRRRVVRVSHSCARVTA